MANNHAKGRGSRGASRRRRGYFYERQVIITGSEASIQPALAGLDGVQAQPIRVLRLAELGAATIDALDVPEDTIIGLYRLTGDRPDVRQAIRAIGAVALDDKLPGKPGRKLRRGPRGEPDLFTGHPWNGEGSPWDGEGSPWDGEGSPWDGEGSPWDGEGSPWDGEGSPWDGEGSPWDGEGSPWDGEGSPEQGEDHKKQKQSTLPVARPEWFTRQWAFRAIELDNPLAGPYPGAARRVTGEGVRVAVLDTSPYFPSLPEGSRDVRVSCLAQVPAEMALHVEHPPMYVPDEPAQAGGQGEPDLRNHGYFIAGLIHAMAPGCELHLIRVLEHDNTGDLFTLEAALFDFLRETVTNPPPHGAIINLSLGIQIPPREENPEMPDELLSLYLLLQAARSLGVLVIAAAGNDGQGADGPQPAEIPAGWDTVLGVASCNQARQLSCFSNCGDIAAPGGDGRSPTQADTDCRSRNEECVDENAAPAVIGPVLVRFPEPAGFQTRYLFWSGSSFAAPLVSGLAALVMEAGGGMTPEAVEQALKDGAARAEEAALGAGVINVRATLAAITG